MSTTDALAGHAPASEPGGLGALAHNIDRWIYVFTAVSFIIVVLTGFVPDSVHKIELVTAGRRPAFPFVLHLHSALMGGFLLVLLTQTILAAAGRIDLHRQLGVAGAVLAAALVIVGFVLVPTMYHLAVDAARTAPPPLKANFERGVRITEDILLLQLRAGIIFPALLLIGLAARKSDPGLHKRMMVLAVAPTLTAAIVRIGWLPTTFPASAISLDIGVIVVIAPLLAWDIIFNRKVHPAYWIALAFMAPLTLALHLAWDAPWWHAAARAMLTA